MKNQQTREFSPLERIAAHPGTSEGIELYIKRDDLLEPEMQGNKWRKLHLLLESGQFGPNRGVLSFGGPFSNYLHALAAAGRRFGFPTAAIVRGMYEDPENPTLTFARACGMQLFFVPKKAYDTGLNDETIQNILKNMPDYAVIPEGGATEWGVAGCAGIAREIMEQTGWDEDFTVCVPAGTGCTAAGIIAGLEGRGRVLVFPATLDRLEEQTILNFFTQTKFPQQLNFQIIKNYCFEGFAELPDNLLLFARTFYARYGIAPDPIYTVKMLYGIFDLLEQKYFRPGERIVAVHTGGTQGWGGFERRFGIKFP